MPRNVFAGASPGAILITVRVAIMTAGSRGDVAPYTGLGHGLARAGHEVTVVTHERFAGPVAAAGLGFRAVPVDPRAELASRSGQRLHRSWSPAGKLTRLLGLARSLVGEVAEALLAAAVDSELLLVNGAVAPLGQVIAEGLDVPCVGVYLQPLSGTREFAPPMIGTGSWGGPANLLGAGAVSAALDLVFPDACRALRARFGLPRRGVRATRRAYERADWPVFHGFSPLVVPRPADWRPGLAVTGYWWPHEAPGARLPDDVEEFLAAGPPPVFVGLGSATVPDPAELSAAVARGLRAAGVRGVVQRGWSGLRAEGDDMLAVGDVPHGLLFPRMAAVVHHAGAGTTAAGLRAGVPAVPVPVQFDAAFWARRLASLGVAPRPVPLRRLTADALGAAVREAIGDPSYGQRATAVAEAIRAEDGVRPVREAVDRLALGAT
ncbi:UDP:flavonoid glycosyltransferase YjiC, YdhE family [Actinacidiphila rubida]|uniref:UDP:flavonoid glycosyltransferase YjiC, YdhE family n=2 Tax=Actinacidiphila rubida TaxID=310780 RepID=A0A1H8MVR0_9ACTN|nr:UDP:flavonoid glycosyltransferase YjiC, YdhE family [Actinacidiphila rubida]